MEIKKANETYDVYNAKLSYLEMRAIADALAAGGEGAIADELRRSFEWHLDRVPGPGEDKEEKKAKDEAAKAGALAPDVKDEVDKLLPEPPSDSDEMPVERDLDREPEEREADLEPAP
jgi:hypothetical protein